MTNSHNVSHLQADVLESYANAGYILFPLKGKIPPKGYQWTKATFNAWPQVEDFPFGNFGVRLTASDLVVDVDPRNFPKDDPDVFKRFMVEYGITSKMCVVTGSGGLHIYLKKPENVPIKSRLHKWPGIDFKSIGGYVVGAGSLHPDTRQPYTLKQPCEYNPGKTPEKLLEDLKHKPLEIKPGVATYLRDKQTKDRFIAYLEKAPIAVEGQSGDKTTYCVCAVGHDFGLHPDDVFELMAVHYNDKCLPPWPIEELKRKVYNAYKYADNTLGHNSPQAANFPIVAPAEGTVVDGQPLVLGEARFTEQQVKMFHRNDTGKIRNDMHNTVVFFTPSFEFDGLLKYDQFADRIVFSRPAPWHKPGDKHKTWTDNDTRDCRFYLSHFYKYEPCEKDMLDAALVAAGHHRFHPVKEYLDGLKWDGHKRINTWLHTVMGAEDNDYTRNVSLKFLVAAVSRIYEPGCQWDYALVFEGLQGTRKSTAFRYLASDDWFTDAYIDISKNDSVMQMHGKWFVEFPEMETFFKADTNAMKGFITRRIDRIRKPYGRIVEDIERSSVIVGTINPEEDPDLGWLKDTTGNRRYWPIATGVTHMPEIDKIPLLRDQLWAEAVVMYRNNTPIYFEDAKIEVLAKEEQQKREYRDPWAQPIYDYLHHGGGRSLPHVTNHEIFTLILNGSTVMCTRRDQMRIAQVMRTIGWESIRIFDKEKNIQSRAYRRPLTITKPLGE